MTHDEAMRQQDRNAQNVIAQAYGLPMPYGVEMDEELCALRARAEEREGLINQLCDMLDKLAINDGPGVGRRIAHAVARQHGLAFHQMVAESRDRPRVHARWHAMWEIRQSTTLSLPQIGKIFNRDHTTVLHGIRRHQERLDSGEVSFSHHRCSQPQAIGSEHMAADGVTS